MGTKLSETVNIQLHPLINDNIINSLTSVIQSNLEKGLNRYSFKDSLNSHFINQLISVTPHFNTSPKTLFVNKGIFFL